MAMDIGYYAPSERPRPVLRGRRLLRRPRCAMTATPSPGTAACMSPRRREDRRVGDTPNGVATCPPGLRTQSTWPCRSESPTTSGPSSRTSRRSWRGWSVSTSSTTHLRWTARWPGEKRGWPDRRPDARPAGRLEERRRRRERRRGPVRVARPGSTAVTLKLDAEPDGVVERPATRSASSSGAWRATSHASRQHVQAPGTAGTAGAARSTATTCDWTARHDGSRTPRIRS